MDSILVSWQEICSLRRNFFTVVWFNSFFFSFLPPSSKLTPALLQQHLLGSPSKPWAIRAIKDNESGLQSNITEDVDAEVIGGLNSAET